MKTTQHGTASECPDVKSGKYTRCMGHQVAMPEDVARRFLRHSFRDINFEYSSLTVKEKELCSKEEFGELMVWLGKEAK